jgi:hypothetical protein
MRMEELSITEMPSITEGSPIAHASSICEVVLPTRRHSTLTAWALAMSPAVVALIVIGGLGTLALENLGGGTGLHHISENHSEAILKLLFRSN